VKQVILLFFAVIFSIHATLASQCKICEKGLNKKSAYETSQHYTGTAQLSCGHTFHNVCIAVWYIGGRFSQYEFVLKNHKNIHNHCFICGGNYSMSYKKRLRVKIHTTKLYIELNEKYSHDEATFKEMYGRFIDQMSDASLDDNVREYHSSGITSIHSDSSNGA